MKIAVLPGDGIGPEIMAEAVAVLHALDLPGLDLAEAPVGAAAWRAHGHPLPPATLAAAQAADAVLFGAVGDPACDGLDRHLRPEQAILGLRSELGLFANLRPARLFPGLEHLSPLRPEIARRIDLLIVRELTGDVYFGDKGQRVLPDGRRQGFDAMAYAEDEVARIADIALRAAAARGGRLTSVDKANVLETSRLWRMVVDERAAAHPGVTVDHMYVDNAAMQLVRAPDRFDTIVTGNLFGDILSDQASMCVGSIGLLPSASLGARATAHGTFGLYEPIHGSAPDIAGRGIANPLGMILSTAMMLRHSFGQDDAAARIERAVAATLAAGTASRDLGGSAGTRDLGAAVRARLVAKD